MSDGKNYLDILRAVSIMGIASAFTILIGLFRVKVLAVLLGPAGVGLMGLYSNIMSSAATLAGLGLGASGVRQVASIAEDAMALARVRRALWTANLGLGSVGGGVLWFLREPMAFWVFGDSSRAGDVGWLGLGVLLSLVSASQTALLQGLRRIRDLASVSVLSSLVGTVGGLVAIAALEQRGIVLFVLITPLASAVVAACYVSRLPRPGNRPSALADLLQQWRSMVGLGMVFMASSLLAVLSQLFVRSLVVHDIGLDAAGHFQAAWAISTQSIGFVLGAMSTDYYPRLTAAIRDRSYANRLVNDQAEVALLLAGPILLGIVALAPWVIRLLYTAEFEPSVQLLRWQMAGDILKVASWPMGFVLIARGSSGWYFCTELAWHLTFSMIIWAALSQYGLVMIGVSYLACYALLFLFYYVLVARLHDFRWLPFSLVLTAVLLASAVLVNGIATWSAQGAAVVGSVAAIAIAVVSWRRLTPFVMSDPRLASRIARLRSLFAVRNRGG